MMKACLLLLWLVPLVSASSTAFKYKNNLSCSNGLSGNLSVYCGDSNQCELGDTAEISGDISFYRAFPSSAKVISEVCFLNVMCKSFEDTINICDDAGLVGVNGETCPEAGSYSLFTTIKVPGEPQNLMYGWSVKVTATLQDEDNLVGNITCSFGIKAVNGSASMAYTGAAALGVAALAFIVLKRRRTASTASIDLLAEERKSEANFEMASQGVSV